MKKFFAGLISGAIISAFIGCGVIWASCGFDQNSAVKFGRGIVYQAADSVIYPVTTCQPDCGINQ